jgi:hypothetical protein
MRSAFSPAFQRISAFSAPFKTQKRIFLHFATMTMKDVEAPPFDLSN